MLTMKNPTRSDAIHLIHRAAALDFAGHRHEADALFDRAFQSHDPFCVGTAYLFKAQCRLGGAPISQDSVGEAFRCLREAAKCSTTHPTVALRAAETAAHFLLEHGQRSLAQDWLHLALQWSESARHSAPKRHARIVQMLIVASHEPATHASSTRGSTALVTTV